MYNVSTHNTMVTCQPYKDILFTLANSLVKTNITVVCTTLKAQGNIYRECHNIVQMLRFIVFYTIILLQSKSAIHMQKTLTTEANHYWFMSCEFMMLTN